MNSNIKISSIFKRIEAETKAHAIINHFFHPMEIPLILTFVLSLLFIITCVMFSFLRKVTTFIYNGLSLCFSFFHLHFIFTNPICWLFLFQSSSNPSAFSIFKSSFKCAFIIVLNFYGGSILVGQLLSFSA